MKFGELIRSSRPDLIISRRYDAWMEKNSNPVYSSSALHFGLSALEAQAAPRDRRGTFSASSLDSCMRKQQFTFLGMPELPPSAKLAAIFQNGTFMHIRWQMAGLTEGWLAAAEVPVPSGNELKLSGTQDGIAYEGSIVEFKSINTNGFSNVATFGPKEAHLAQGATYAACTGAEKVTFIYEDKNTQEYREIVKTREELPIAEVTERASALWESVETESLAEPLHSCTTKTGQQYNSCQFRNVCLSVRGYEHAREVAG